MNDNTKKNARLIKRMTSRGKILGASVFGVICAATIYMVEHYSQDRRRHGLARDVERLNGELATLRSELNELLKQQKDKVDKIKRSGRSGNRPRKAESIVSMTTTTDDYLSAVDLDSDDLEFYDVSDEEDVTTVLELVLQEIDYKLENATCIDEVERCLDRLKNLCIEHPESPDLLWRIGQAHFKIQEKTDDKALILEHLGKGIEACSAALPLKPELVNVHKWLAILAGARSSHLGIKERIMDANLLKIHAEKGVKLNPVDPVLHHMLGRFDYEMAELTWIERKAASALFGEMPSASYEEALQHLLETEKYSEKPWKENKLSVAKCYIRMGKIDDAVRFLEEADKIVENNGVSDKVDQEVKELLEKYKS